MRTYCFREPMAHSYCLSHQINNQIHHKLSMAMEFSSGPSLCALTYLPSHSKCHPCFCLPIHVSLFLSHPVHHSHNWSILKYTIYRYFVCFTYWYATECVLSTNYTHTLSLSLLDYKMPWEQGMSVTYNNILVLT